MDDEKLVPAANISPISNSKGFQSVPKMGLPTGVGAETWQRKAMVEKQELAAFESRPKELIFTQIPSQQITTRHSL